MKIEGTGSTRSVKEVKSNRDETAKPGDRGAVRARIFSLARDYNADLANEERPMHKLQLLIHGLQTAPLPLLFRRYKSGLQNNEREEHRLNQAEAHSTGETTLEFIVETATLGVVVIRMEKKDGLYALSLLVESGSTGRILEKGFAGLRNLISRILQEKKISLAICRWEIIPVLDMQEIKEDLHKFSFLLDRKV